MKAHIFAANRVHFISLFVQNYPVTLGHLFPYVTKNEPLCNLRIFNFNFCLKEGLNTDLGGQIYVISSKASLQMQNEPFFVEISNTTYFAFYANDKGSIFFKTAKTITIGPVETFY